MKKLALVIAVAGIIGLSSCAKCQTCTLSGSTDQEICKSDYADSQILYDAAIASFEASGYTCK